MGLEDIFSEENILGYANACINLALDMPESKRFDTLIIPSRGALPIFLGMFHALPKFSWNENHKRFYEGLCVQEIMQPLLPQNSRLNDCLDNNEIKVLLLPFTADLKLHKSELEEIEYTRKTREYWARVALSFMRSPQNRVKDPYFKVFTDLILRDIENRGKLAEAYERFPRARDLGLIDTVISGRASNDILQAFDQLSLTEDIEGASPDCLLPQSFLIIDENGAKLKSKFSVYLNRKKATGATNLYYMPRIVSEDEGASLEGVAAIVYPSIMEASKKLLFGNREFFVGAGSWYIAPQSPYKQNFHRFMDLIYKAIDAKYAKDYQDNPSKEVEIFRAALPEFVKYASEVDILTKHHESLSKVGWPYFYEPRTVYETGSHVVHIGFTDKSTHRAVSKIIHVCQNSYPVVKLKEEAKTPNISSMNK